MNKRKKKSVSRLSSSLTGRVGLKSQAFAIQQLRKWKEELNTGESIAFICESVVSDKQFKIWKKWFERHEDKNWDILEKEKTFFFFKKLYL